MMLVLLTMIIYYVPAAFFKRERVRRSIQQGALLTASMVFYYFAGSIPGCILFATTVIVSWGLGILLGSQRLRQNPRLSRFLLLCAVLLCLSPLLIIKTVSFFALLRERIGASIIVPLGVSFYTLQIVAYLCDCWSGKTKPERNLFRYALFTAYFPQIVQGPIPRHKELAAQFGRYHCFEPEEFVGGFQRILWGCFLKLMIADKAAPVVNLVFGQSEQYGGGYVLIAAVLYSIQLYTDFYSCVSICRGVSELFGIRLRDNFRQPYLAVSIQDFWRRWHISLSTWLRDYVYIPLGGSRKGVFRTYINLMLVFLVSGFWHGNGYHFIFWGLLNGAYQAAGKLFSPVTGKLVEKLRIRKESFSWKLLMRIKTFALATTAWLFFRADNLRIACRMIKNLFSFHTPWLFFGKSAFTYGLDVYEWATLLASLLVLVVMGELRERRLPVRSVFNRQSLPVRWFAYLLVICAIWVFGAYGVGYNAAEYIYGGF